MPELPTGTVTFLFTDIEGSTKLLRELGDDYADALAEHRRLLRDAFARHDGVEVDTQGDAFFVAFARAKDALAAAADGQEALAGGPIRVRMGLHTGEPIATDEGYVGIDVHRAARIAAAGHGGQVLVSGTTYDLAGIDDLRDLGEHRLKDLSAPERLFQLGTDEFPPLKTLYQTNLPVPATPFLGRERELAEVGELLGRPAVRLLTLTGAGGTGKTRLALQAAAAAADTYPQGVWWVPLAPVRDVDAVLETAARTLGAAGRLEDAVGDRRLLLLLDNLEHVIDAAPGITTVLAECPNLDVVATSRERLRLAAEQVYPVPVLARTDAHELFIARARAVRPGFEGNGAVDELCERLDNLPLALELAAARTTILSTEQLLSRLGKRLDLLRGGRDAEVRQQTLRATIEWSYDLLEPPEQVLFARLAVFRGGCTLAAAEAVCDADLDDLQSLVDKSLVRVRDEGRFWMLETIREFAAERLRDSGEEQEIRAAHARFFLNLAQSAHLSSDEIDLGQRYEIVIPEEDNLRGAIDSAFASADFVLAAKLLIALESFWVAQDPYEGARRAEALLAAASELPPALRARVLRVVGGTVFIVGDFERGTEFHRKSLAAFRELGDELASAHIVHRLATEAQYFGDLDRARTLTTEALEVTRRFGSPSGEAMALGVLAQIEWAEGRREPALELALRCADSAAQVGFTWWQVHYLYVACEWSLDLGRTTEGEQHGRAALRLAHEIRDRQMTVYMLALLARAAAPDRPDRAGRLWGALENEAARGPIGQWEGESEQYGAPILVHRGPAFEHGREQGRRLSLDEVVEYALSVD